MGLKLKNTKELLHAKGDGQWVRRESIARLLPMGRASTPVERNQLQREPTNKSTFFHIKICSPHIHRGAKSKIFETGVRFC